MSVALNSPYHLQERHFALTLCIAAMLHVAVFVAYLFMPHDKVIDIPVRILNIRLGSGDALEAISAEQPSALPAEAALTPEKEAAPAPKNEVSMNARPGRGSLNRLERAIAQRAATLAKSAAEAGVAQKNAKRKERLSEAAVSARQFVRERDIKSPVKTPGLEFGNSAASKAEILARYEQTISAWIEKFRVYPPEARSQGIRGDGVVRIRIDRRGTMRYHAIEKSTGHEALDRAALEMVRRANPMPPVPSGYPAGELIEFLIPVSFRL